MVNEFPPRSQMRRVGRGVGVGLLNYKPKQKNNKHREALIVFLRKDVIILFTNNNYNTLNPHSLKSNSN